MSQEVGLLYPTSLPLQMPTVVFPDGGQNGGGLACFDDGYDLIGLGTSEVAALLEPDVSLAAHTAPAAQLTPRAKLPVSKELRIAPGCACNPLLRSPKVVSQPLVSPRRPQCKHAVAIAVATPVALAALADEHLRATPVQLCGPLGARTELNPVYRQLLKVALKLAPRRHGYNQGRRM